MVSGGLAQHGVPALPPGRMPPGHWGDRAGPPAVAAGRSGPSVLSRPFIRGAGPEPLDNLSEFRAVKQPRFYRSSCVCATLPDDRSHCSSCHCSSCHRAAPR